MSDRVKDVDVFLKWLKDNKGNEDVSYNRYNFDDGYVFGDHMIPVKSLGINLYIDFGDSGNLNLSKSETGGFPAFGVDFELENKYHNGFYFKIRYRDGGNTAIKIWFYSYEHFSTFLSYLDISITDPVKDRLIARYKELIEKAGDDCNKLDVIYETIPDFVAKAIPDETLYQNMEALGSCSIGNYNWKRLWWGATDEVQALINILNGFDSKWIYQKINTSPEFLEKLLREKVGVRANSIDKFLVAITEIAADNWEEGDLSYTDYIVIGGEKINILLEYGKLSRLGLTNKVTGFEESVFVNGCCPSQIGSYNFGNQILIENPVFAAGSILGCTGHISKKALEPIITENSNGEAFILPALVAKYLLEETDRKAFNEILNTHLGLLMPEVLVKPATLTKWSKFLKGKGTIAMERESWYGWKNIFKATSEEISEAGMRITNYRTTNKVKGGNLGYIEGIIDGKTLNNRMWRSGQALEGEAQIFQAVEIEGASGSAWLRTTDSEYKMLNNLASELGGKTGQMYPQISGQLKIISENPYCTSCTGVIQQFNEMFPSIKIILIDGVKVIK